MIPRVIIRRSRPPPCNWCNHPAHPRTPLSSTLTIHHEAETPRFTRTPRRNRSIDDASPLPRPRPAIPIIFTFPSSAPPGSIRPRGNLHPEPERLDRERRDRIGSAPRQRGAAQAAPRARCRHRQLRRSEFDARARREAKRHDLPRPDERPG